MNTPPPVPGGPLQMPASVNPNGNLTPPITSFGNPNVPTPNTAYLPSFAGPLQMPDLSNPAPMNVMNFNAVPALGGRIDYTSLLANLGHGNSGAIPTSDVAKAVLANTSFNAKPKQGSGGYSLWNRISDLLGSGTDLTASLYKNIVGGYQQGSAESTNPVLSTLEGIGGGALGFLKTGPEVLARAGATLNPLNHQHDPNTNDWIKNLVEMGPHADELKTGMTHTAVDERGNPTGPLRQMTPDEYKQLMYDTASEGVFYDLLADPLNFITGGASAASKAKAATEVASVADKAGTIPEDLKNIGKVTSNLPENAPVNNAKLSDLVLNSIAHGPSGVSATETAGEVAKNAADGASGVLPKMQAASPVRTNINPDTFNSMLRDVIGERNAAAPVSVPSIAAKTGTETAVDLTDPAHAEKTAGAVMRNAMRLGGPGSWTNMVVRQLNNAYPDVRFENATKYMQQLGDKGPRIFQNLATSPEARQKFVGVLTKVLQQDANKGVVPAEKIVDGVKSGDQIAESIARPAPIGPVLNPDHLELANRILTGEGKVQGLQKTVESGIFPGARDPQAVASAVDKGLNARWSGPTQVNTWQSILSNLAMKGSGKYVAANRILRHIEDTLMSQGHVPHSSSKLRFSVPLRLSDVIAKIGPAQFAKNENYGTTLLRSVFADPTAKIAGASEAAEKAPDLATAVKQAYEAAKAGSAISEAPAIKQGIQAGDNVAKMATQSILSDPRKAGETTIAGKVAEDIARSAGAGPLGQKTASTFIKAMYLDSDKVQSAITKSSTRTIAALRNGLNDPKFSNAAAVTKAIQDTIGGPSVSSLGSVVGPDANALEWMGSRFAASYGLFGNGSSKLAEFFGPLFNPAYKNAQLRPIYLQEAAYARASVSARAKIWNDAAKQFSKDPAIWTKAMQAAQGHMPAVPGSAEEQLSKLMLQHLENLFGSSGIKDLARADSTLAGRTQLTMKELNSNLKRYGLGGFKFTNGEAVRDAMGNTQDYSKGVDWLNSWQSWKINNPMRFMMQIANSAEMTAREAQMWREIGERFGNKSVGNALSTDFLKKYPRLRGYKFSGDMVEQINQFARNLEDIKKPGSPLMAQFDKVLSKWKTVATLYMPSHHMNNLIGDTYQNWLAGVNDVRAYSDAIKVMRSQSGRYSQLEDLGNLTSPNAVMQAISRAKTGESLSNAPRGNQILFTMKNGMHVTNDMLYTSAFRNGILPAAHMLDDLPETDVSLMKLQPFNGKVREAINTAAEYREHFVRLAQYIDSIKKSGASIGFEEAARNASGAVRKWHPDGMDLTKFERNVVRRIFPFYSWTRKAIPLMVEGLVAAPGKSTLYPRAAYAYQVMSGQNVNTQQGFNYGDPFPVDQLFPDWLTEKGIGPLSGSPGHYDVYNLHIPTLDLAGGLNQPGTFAAGMLNPAIKVPIELMQQKTLEGQNLQTQAQLTKYATQQIPGLFSAGVRMGNLAPSIAPNNNRAPQQDNGFNVGALINTLTGVNPIDTSKYIASTAKNNKYQARQAARGQ